MSEMPVVWRGLVNAWECDEMGHLNVRGYVSRSLDGIATLGAEFGFGPRRLDGMQMSLVPSEQHIRFLRELRPGAACFIRAGVLSVDESELHVLQELVRLEDGEVSATIQSHVMLGAEPGWHPQVLPGELQARASNAMIELPEYAKARGMQLKPPRPEPSLEEADKLGLIEGYRGVVGKQEIDLMCRMNLEGFMGRISDAMPTFFGELGDLDRDPKADIGGAALEYRLVYREPPLLGDVLVVRSGLKVQRSKTTHFCHWLFNAESGECVCTAEGVAVRLDLKTRAAMTMPEDAVQRLQSKAIAELSP